MTFSRTVPSFFLQHLRVNTLGLRCFQGPGISLAPVPGNSGQRASGALITVNSGLRRRLSSTHSSDITEGVLAEELGFALGLRQGAYLALVSDAAADPATANRIQRSVGDALFQLAYLYSASPGCPEELSLIQFFAGFVAGRRRAKVLLSEPPSSPSLAEGGEVTAVLLSYRQVFRWSRALPAPLAGESEVSADILWELGQKVREELPHPCAENLDSQSLENFLGGGFSLFAGAEPQFLLPHPLQAKGGPYRLFGQAFGQAYHLLGEISPEAWASSAGQKRLREKLD